MDRAILSRTLKQEALFLSEYIDNGYSAETVKKQKQQLYSISKEGGKMLESMALMILAALAASLVMNKLNLPGLLGMMITGVILGPCCLNLIDAQILDLSGFLRKIALLIILIRAGLNLKTADLKRAGRPAVLLSFVPATFEILAFALLGPLILDLSVMDSVLLGTVMAAVSPAVVVPGMLKVMKAGYGNDKAIPQMILAGASADDAYVLVLFSVFSALAQAGEFHPELLLRIPTAIVLGILAGIGAGWLCAWLFRKLDLQLPIACKVLVLMALGMLMYGIEDHMSGMIGFSGLIATMASAMTLKARLPQTAGEMAVGFDHLWKAGELFLFTLIGAAIQIDAALGSFGSVVLILVLALLIRCIGVWLCTVKTRLNLNERIFVVMAELPKATVQAAIGAVPLSMGLACGQTILCAAVWAIVITAPLGAVLIHVFYPRLLAKDAA